MRWLALSIALVLGGCGTVYPLTADPSIPFAEGRVMASRNDDGTVEIDLDTLHMGDPGKLDPAATTYVVWIRPLGQTDAKPENVGGFKPNTELKGWLSFKTKHKDIELFVTPEASADAAAPTGHILLKGEVSGVGAASPVGAPPTQPSAPPEQGAPQPAPAEEPAPAESASALPSASPSAQPPPQ
ncbi:MAG: hypothetical protein HOV80_01670 [Polyangiaceae bacterium]|nr:hypothetical protein [Polyangiaceae bacterium]